MSTRSGDLDPGVIMYLLKDRGMNAAALNHLVNKEAGLLGVSGTSSDIRELLDREAADRRAAQAVELFCCQAKKFLGVLAAAQEAFFQRARLNGLARRGKYAAAMEKEP